ncbi:hypothetical protein F4813DRAFT_368022, partial [Daldinia decipiens]|uniref:uncharacterized protein n=1 Tax=Daldinia decipiens TaxID=326647 RepID=UPI0020C56E94
MVSNVVETLTWNHTDSGIENLRTLLCWLLYARRPLRIKELRETVAFEWLEMPCFYPKKRFNKKPSFVDQCDFLIAIDGDSHVNDIFAIDVDDDTTSSCEF